MILELCKCMLLPWRACSAALPGFEWEGAWQVDPGGNVDTGGWAYGSDFGFMGFPPQRVGTAKSCVYRFWQCPCR